MSTRRGAAETRHADTPAAGASRWLPALTPRRAVLLAALAFALLAALLFVAHAVTEHRAAYAEAADRVRIGAGQVAEQAGRVLDGADLALRLALTRVDGRSWDVLAADRQLHAELARLAGGVVSIEALSLQDAAGDTRASSRSFPAPAINIADREHFRVQVERDAGAYVSRQLRNRLTGLLTAVVSRRIEDPDGSFRGVATAVLQTGRLTGLWARIGLEAGGEITLWRLDGALVARWPELPPEQAETLVRPPAAALPVAEVGGTPLRRSVADRVVRIAAEVPVPGFPVRVEMGLAADVVEAAWRQRMLGEGLVVLAGLVAVGGMAAWAATLARRVESANVELEGRVRARTAELERAMERQTLLLHEVNHRVKNNLQIVAGLLGMQAREADEAAARALGEARARVVAIADLHKSLYADARFDRVELGTYLRDLARELWNSSGDAARPIRVEAEPIEVGPDTVVPLGLAVVELVTNALKYAYDPGEPGGILIRLERGESAEGGHELRLAVIDDGRGLAPNGQRGLGTRLVEALVAQLGGRIGRSPGEAGGTTVRLTVPLPEAGAGDRSRGRPPSG